MKKAHIIIAALAGLIGCVTATVVATLIAPKAADLMAETIAEEINIINNNNNTMPGFNLWQLPVYPVLTDTKAGVELPETYPAEYVCNMDKSNSKEFYIYPYINRSKVFRPYFLHWQSPMPIPSAMLVGVEMFSIYTGLDVSIGVDVPQGIDIDETNVIPVHFDIPNVTFDGQVWAGVWTNSGLYYSGSGYLAFNPDAANYDNNTIIRIVLHELGHMIGLEHTHEHEGIQKDSIMSYEQSTHDPEVGHYLTGDIAGLQYLLCD